MKISLTVAALFFLGVSGTMFLLLYSVSVAEDTAAEGGLAPGGEGPIKIPPGVREAVRKAHAAIEAVLAHEGEDVEARTRKALTSELKEALALWESNASPRAALAERIAGDLEVSRRACKLDLLLLVTQDNEVFSAETTAAAAGSADRQALARASIIVAAEPYFRDGKVLSGVEALPDEHGPSGAAGEVRRSSGANLFVVAGMPIWLRPDAPHSVLIGGVTFQSLRRAVEGAFEPLSEKLRWHAFLDERGADERGTGPAVIAGVGVGSPLRRSFYQTLVRDSATEEPAFEGEALSAGRWSLLRARDGQVLGGWGVTLDPAYLRDWLAPQDAEGQPALAGLAALPTGWVYYAGVAAAGLGIVLLLFLVRSHRQKQGRPRPMRTLSPLEHSKPLVLPPPAARSDDLISQFEINWKTFASYTQDLLHQKLKELEDAPQKGVKEVREQVARLSEALGEIKRDLAAARTEARDTTHGVVEQVAHLVAEESREKKDLSVEGEALLRKIEGDFDKATSRFAQLDQTVVRLADVFGEKQDQEIEERVKAEVAKLEAQWNDKVVDFAAEIDEAKKQGQGLLEDLERAKEAESDLRRELKEAAGREEAIRRDVSEREKEVQVISQERETAWRREREVIEELHGAKLHEDESRGRIAALEEAARGLEAALAEGRLREEDLRCELEAARADGEKLREAIKEIYREEGRFQKDLERKEEEFEKERLDLVEKIRALEAKVSGLEATGGKAVAEHERLRGLSGAREGELEAVRSAFEALKEEKAVLERAAERLGGEVEALRAERGAFDIARLRELEEESSRMRKSLPELEHELKQERHDLANAVQALEIHRIELVEQTELLAQAGAEVNSLRAELEQKSMELERLRKTADEREKELGPAKEALEKALHASLAESKRLREANDLRVDEARAERESFDRAVQSGKAEVERLERLSRDQDRRLQGSDEERLRLKSKLAEAETLLRSQQGERELKAAEAERKLAESQRRLAEAEISSRGLRSQLDQALAATRASDEAADRLRALERERGELSSSIDRLGKELERVRNEAEGVRRFQGTLVDGCIPAAIVAFDTALKVFAWNPRAEGLWRRAASAVLGRTLPEISVKGIDRSLIDLARRAMDEGKAASVPQSSFSDEKGKVRHVRLSCDPILGPQGEALGGVLIAEEITEKVEHEIEARLQGLFSKSLTRSLPGALVVVDGQRRVISWNRSAETILGVPENSALGQDFFSLGTPLAKDAFQRHFEAARKDRAAHRVKVRFEVKGVPTGFVVTQAPFLGSDDSVRGTILLVQEAVEAVEARR